MIIIGITGKSGSGKSTICRALANKLDGKIIDFDDISHKCLAQQSIIDFVSETFGKDIINNNGEIDRKKLGEIVFCNTAHMNTLNDVVYKEMIKIIDNIIKYSNKRYLILDYLLLPQTKYFDKCNYKILVNASIKTRFERVMERDGLTLDYITKRENNSIDFKENDFDIVINNDGTKDLQNINDEIVKKITKGENYENSFLCR